MGTSCEHHWNIWTSLPVSSDLEILLIVVVRSHGQQQPPVSWDLDTVVAVHTIGNDRLCLGSWTLFGHIHTVVDNHLCLGSWTLVVALSHSRRWSPACLGTWTLCCGAFAQSETTTSMSWDFDTVVARSHHHRRPPTCLRTRILLWRVHTSRGLQSSPQRRGRRTCEGCVRRECCGIRELQFLLLLFSTSWVLRLLTSFSTRSLGTHKRWWRRGRRKSIGLDPIFWGVFGGYTQPEIDDIAEVGSRGTQASSLFGNFCCWVSVSVSCLCLCRKTVLEMQRLEIQSWIGKE